MENIAIRESYWPADTKMPILNMSIGEALTQAAIEVPERVALVEVVPAQMPLPVDASATDRRWTYEELHKDALHCAYWLLARFNPGDRICVWAPNVPEWVILQCGAAIAGMVLVTANPALKATELRYVLKQSQAKALFHLKQFRGVDTGSVALEMEDLSIDRCEFEGWLESIRKVGALPLASVEPEAPAQIQYTSGTTGEPKGALLHHRGLITNASYVAARAGLDGSVLVSPMPLFHTAGSVMSVLGCIASRSTLVLPLLFEPNTVLDAIEREQGEVLFGVPTMLIALLEAIKSKPRNLTSLHTSLSGGAPVPLELHRRVKESLGTVLLTVYGQTEASPIISQTSRTDELKKLTETTGKPLANVEVRIVDPFTLAVVPLGTEGEIQARGYQVMLEYFGNKAATHQAITDDGWLRTGDLGTIDREGYVRVTGRIKDMIIRGGENIYPVEIEACLLQHPDVAEVAVFGVPDQKWGEVVAAAVRPRSGAMPSSEQLLAYCRERLAPHKAPSLWFSIREFPMTTSGKVQKFRLRDATMGGQLETL